MPLHILLLLLLLIAIASYGFMDNANLIIPNHNESLSRGHTISLFHVLHEISHINLVQQ